MLSRLCVAAALLLVLAGCVAPAATDLRPASVVVAGGSSSWSGSGLKPDASTSGDFHGLPCLPYACDVTYALACGVECLPTCGATNCERRMVEVPAGATGDLVVAAQSIDHDSGLRVDIADASGKLLVRGEPGEYAGVARLEHAAPGTYQAQVMVEWGEGKFEASAHLVPSMAPSEGAKHDLLADLVTLPPGEIRIEDPGSDVDQRAVDLLGAKACSSYEFVEAQAKKCLRFSNAVANVGEGRLQVRLAQRDLATGAAGAASFEQLVDQSDGSTRVQQVGAATFHPTHQHYHYAGLAHYDLYRLEADGTRGPKAAEGKKSGFCFLDSGLLNVSQPARLPWFYAHANCFQAAYSAIYGTAAQDEVMGISPGWYDYYNWYLDDQFIDISNVPDGSYQLVSCANSERTLVEANPDNNCASVNIALHGNKVTTL